MTTRTVEAVPDDHRSRAAAAARARLRPGDGGDPVVEPELAEPEPVVPAEPEPAEAIAPAEGTAPAPVTHGTVTHDTVAHDTGARRSRRGRLLTAGLAGLCVVLAAVLALTLVDLRQGDAAAGARGSALAAARSDALALTTYSYTDLGGAADRVLANATPAFRKQYTSSSGGLDTVLRQYKASATGKVVAAGLASASSNRAVALVFVNQTVNNTTDKKGPTTDESRLQMTLVRDGGRWLVSQVRLL